MKAVITVIGKDMVGILAKVSAVCSDKNANVLDVTQTIMEDLFAMIMMIDAGKLNVEFKDFSAELKNIGETMGLSINVMHEDIFNSMHKI